jgi:hypothetical protein
LFTLTICGEVTLSTSACPDPRGGANLPLTGSGKIQKFLLRERLDRAELPELP